MPGDAVLKARHSRSCSMFVTSGMRFGLSFKMQRHAPCSAITHNHCCCRFSKAISATNARLRAASAANQTCARFLDCNAVFLEVDHEVRARFAENGEVGLCWGQGALRILSGQRCPPGGQGAAQGLCQELRQSRLKRDTRVAAMQLRKSTSGDARVHLEP